jgi:hypothetical protein
MNDRPYVGPQCDRPGHPQGGPANPPVTCGYCHLGRTTRSIAAVKYGRQILRAVYRILTDENVDLWLLTAAAGVFTVLGIVNVANASVLSSAILALLAVMATAQLRSRRQVAEITRTRRVDPTDLLTHNFPDDLIQRRANSNELLLIGMAMARTIQGSRDDLDRALRRGAVLRVLLVDPTHEELVGQASLLRPTGRSTLLSQRIRTSLDELVDLRDSTAGDLQIRVAPFVPTLGVNLMRGAPVDTIVVQHNEHRPDAEPGPIIQLSRSDGEWFSYYERQAERMWAAGTPWPPTPKQRTTQASRIGSAMAALSECS